MRCSLLLTGVGALLLLRVNGGALDEPLGLMLSYSAGLHAWEVAGMLGVALADPGDSCTCKAVAKLATLFGLGLTPPRGLLVMSRAERSFLKLKTRQGQTPRGRSGSGNADRGGSGGRDGGADDHGRDGRGDGPGRSPAPPTPLQPRVASGEEWGWGGAEEKAVAPGVQSEMDELREAMRVVAPRRSRMGWWSSREHSLAVADAEEDQIIQ